MISFNEYEPWIKIKYKEAIRNIKQLLFYGCEARTVIKGLSSSSLSVLMTALKVGEKSSLFNFEAVYQKYKLFMTN